MGTFKEITNFILQFLIAVSILSCFINNNSVRGNLIDEKILEYADYTLQDLLERYENTEQSNFWHPNSFKTGVQSREVIRVSAVSKKWIPGVYKQWRYAQLGSRTIIVGLTDYSIDFYDDTLRQVGNIKSYEYLVTLTVFSEWNDEMSRPEIIVVVATREPSLQSYSFTNETVQILGKWPVPNTVQSLELCTVDISRKIVVVPESHQVPVDIYNFEVDHNSSQLWFFQRINVEQRTCVTVHELESSCSITIASDHKIGIYSFEPRMGYFDEQTKFTNISAPCQQLISFSLAYSEYIAHVPQSQYGRNVEFFSETGNDYLNQKSSPIQATDIVSLPAGDYRDEDILIVRTPSDTIKLLSYDGVKKMFRETFVCSPDTCPIQSNLENGVGTLINGTTVYFSPTQGNQNHALILIISTQIEEYTSPVYERARQLYTEFRTLTDQYIRFQTIISNVRTALDDALSQTSPNVIQGSWTVREMNSLNTQIYELNENSSFNYHQNFQHVEFHGVPLYPVDFTIVDAETDNKLNIYNSLISSAEIRTMKTVPLDSQEVIQVSAHHSVVNGFVKSSSIKSHQMKVGGINGITDLDDLINGMALLDHSGSTLGITKPTQFHGLLTITDLETYEINNIPTQHLAWLSSKNTFNSTILFEKRFHATESIGAYSVGGYRFPDDLVLSTNVIGVTLHDLIALDHSQISVPVRSVNLDREELQRDILTTDTSQTITSHIHFSNIVLRENGNVNTLNNDNFVELANSIIRTDHNGVIRGSKIIQSASITTTGQSVTIVNSLNSVPFPSGFISVNERSINLNGFKNFAYLSANSVELIGTINEINTHNMVRKNASPGEFINTEWILLDAVNFVGDVQLQESIGGVNFSDFFFRDTFDVPKEKYFPNYHIVIDAPVELKYIHVDNDVNQKSFEESFGNALVCDETHTEVFVKGLTTFQSDVVFGHVNVQSNKVNGIDFDNFFHQNKEQNITNKHFVFSQAVAFSKIIALSLIDLVDVRSVLRNALTLNAPQQVLPPQLVFDSIFSANTMTINGPINNFQNFSTDVALKSGRIEQVFETHLTFSEAEMTSLYVTDNLAALSSFEQLNITRWIEDRVTFSKEAVLLEPVEIVERVTFEHDINTNSINGLALNYLNSGVLRTDWSVQQFQSPVGILNSVETKGHVQFYDSLNDYSMSSAMRDFVPINGDKLENIYGEWQLEDAVFDSLNVGRLTCGVDVVNMYWDSVRHNATDDITTFTGVTTFLGNVQAENQIEANLVNSVPFSSNLFTLHTPQVITTDIVWKNDVNFENDVEIVGKVNDISLEQLNSVYSLHHTGAHVVNTSVKFTSFATEHLVVEGLIQERNLNQYLSTVAYKSVPNQKINGFINFTKPIISNGDITTTTSYNGLRLPALAQATVLKTSTFKFSHPVSFRQLVSSDSFIVQNGDISTVNNMVGSQLNTQEIQDNSIPIFSNEPIYMEKLTFEKLIVNGELDGVRTVNNIPLTDFITLHTEQELGSLRVNDVTLTQPNITIGGLFGNVDLYNGLQNTVLISKEQQIHPNQTITGRKRFTGKVTINGGFECLGQDKMSQLVYIQEPDQRIQSRVAFDGDFKSNGDVHVTTGKWNSHSLTELKESAVTKFGDDVLSGDWYFSEGVIFANSTVSHGLIDGVNMSQVEEESRVEVDRVGKILMEEHNTFSHYCQSFQNLVKYSYQSPMKLQSFDEQQLIISKRSVESMLTVKAGNELFLLVSSDSCGVFVYKWSIEYEQFYEFSQVLVNETVDKWAHASSSDHGIIVFSTSYSNCYQGMNTGLYFVTMNEQGYVSRKELISQGAIVDFKLVTDDSNTTTLLFVVFEEYPENIVVYSWQTDSYTFTTDTTLTMSTLIKTMDVNVPRDGNVEILLQTALRVSMFIYSSLQRRVTELNHAEFYGSSNSMKMFQADQSLYALVLSRSSERSSIKPDCGVQLFQATGGELQFVQKLSIYDMVAMEVVHIKEQVYVLILTKPVGLYIYKFMGLSGLQEINNYPLKFHHGENLNAFHVTPWRYNTSLPFVLISSHNTIKLYHTNILGNAITDPSHLSKFGSYDTFCNL